MVTKTAEIAWPDIGAEEFFAVVDLIILQHEICMENSRTTFLIMKSFSVAT